MGSRPGLLEGLQPAIGPARRIVASGEIRRIATSPASVVLPWDLGRSRQNRL